MGYRLVRLRIPQLECAPESAHHMARCPEVGEPWAAIALLAASAGGKQLNTAFIERLNATFRQRLASLTRRCRHASRKLSRLEAGMWLVGCTYNFCWPHHELSRRAAKAQDRRGEELLTPAMESRVD